MLKFIPFLMGIFFMASCAKPVAIINPSQELDSVQLCASYKYGVTEEYRKETKRALEYFIAHHNADETEVKIKGCRNKYADATINLVFEPPLYVTGKQNLYATAGNVVGVIALPLGMATYGAQFIAGVYMWPDTRTNVRVIISEDIVSDVGPEFPVVLKTPGYFTSLRKQNIKQARGFYTQLYLWFHAIEKQEVYDKKDISRL